MHGGQRQHGFFRNVGRKRNVLRDDISLAVFGGANRLLIIVIRVYCLTVTSDIDADFILLIFAVKLLCFNFKRAARCAGNLFRFTRADVIAIPLIGQLGVVFVIVFAAAQNIDLRLHRLADRNSTRLVDVFDLHRGDVRNDRHLAGGTNDFLAAFLFHLNRIVLRITNRCRNCSSTADRCLHENALVCALYRNYHSRLLIVDLPHNLRVVWQITRLRRQRRLLWVSRPEVFLRIQRYIRLLQRNLRRAAHIALLHQLQHGHTFLICPLCPLCVIAAVFIQPFDGIISIRIPAIIVVIRIRNKPGSLVRTSFLIPPRITKFTATISNQRAILCFCRNNTTIAAVLDRALTSYFTRDTTGSSSTCSRSLNGACIIAVLDKRLFPIA